MTKYCINLPRQFRHGGGPTGHDMLHPGVYRVPEDISETLGERAMRECGATLCENPVKPRRKKPAAKPKRVARRKAPAPENKVLGAAPENKAEESEQVSLPESGDAAPGDPETLV